MNEWIESLEGIEDNPRLVRGLSFLEAVVFGSRESCEMGNGRDE